MCVLGRMEASLSSLLFDHGLGQHLAKQCDKSGYSLLVQRDSDLVVSRTNPNLQVNRLHLFFLRLDLAGLFK
jgi:hypothetical protein